MMMSVKHYQRDHLEVDEVAQVTVHDRHECRCFINLNKFKHSSSQPTTIYISHPPPKRLNSTPSLHLNQELDNLGISIKIGFNFRVIQ